MHPPSFSSDGPKEPLAFIDLNAQQDKIRPAIDQAIKKVLDHGLYVMGPEVEELEEKLSKFCSASYTISCSNGTDALGLGLRVKKVGSGDAVFVPSFTFAATAEVVAWMGATPVFVDVLRDTFNMDPESLEKGVHRALQEGLRPMGIIPVDLFGQPADYDALQSVADRYGLWVIADAAQSFGATYKGRFVGTLGCMTTTSFFPAKPLGCYGDGGAIFTQDEEVAHLLKSLRIHGQGETKYDNIHIGVNGRLDTLQAAILLEKLKIFPQELQARQRAADLYHALLKDKVQTPVLKEEMTSAWAQYTIKLPQAGHREPLMAHLKAQGIPTAIYYTKPLHMQPAYQRFLAADTLPVSQQLSQTVLSLPMSGYLKEQDIYRISEEIHRFFNAL